MNQSDHNSTAVLLLAHGTPNVLGEMPAYLAKVTGGRALPPSVVAELQHRYAQIGLGETPTPEPPPLTRWTSPRPVCSNPPSPPPAIPCASTSPCATGAPSSPTYVAKMRADGVNRILAICLAPQNSSTSTGLYRRALTAALADEAAQSPSAPKPSLTFIESWSEEPSLIAAFAQRLVDIYSRACAESSRKPNPSPSSSPPTPSPAAPSSSSESNPAPDPYPIEAKRTAELVFASAARRLPNLKKWFFAFQSQGVAGGPWIGPTVEDTLARHSRRGPPRTRPPAHRLPLGPRRGPLRHRHRLRRHRAHPRPPPLPHRKPQRLPAADRSPPPRRPRQRLALVRPR